MQLARVPAGDPVQAFDDVMGLMTAASAEALRMIPDFDRSGRWRRDGATCMAGWLAGRYGLAHGTAREWVRVAHALEELPRVADAHRRGVMSWDQLRPVTKLATPETDAHWARRGGQLRPQTLQKQVERREKVLREDAEEARKRRGVSWFWENEGTAPVLHLSGVLPGSQGAAFEQALRARALGVEVEEDVADPSQARLADALVGAVTGAPAGYPVRPTLVVHVNAEALVGTDEDTGLCETASGVRLASAEVREMLDAAKLEWVLERDGKPIGIGRSSRKAPGWLKRLVEFRDEQRCVWTGCERKGHPRAHHIDWWAGGGGTDLDNLVTLCGDHHRMIHKGGWTIRGRPGEGMTFVDPQGRPLRDRPPELRPEIRERYFP